MPIAAVKNQGATRWFDFTAVVVTVANRIYTATGDRLKRKRGAFSNKADIFKKKLY